MMNEKPYQGKKPYCTPLEKEEALEGVWQVMHGRRQFVV